MKISRMLPLATAAILLAAGLSGCSAPVSLDAAVDSNNPLCADVMVRLPDTVDGLTRRGTNAQSTGAWGTPARVILRCGLPEVKVSKLTCVTEAGNGYTALEKTKYVALTSRLHPCRLST